MNQSLIDRVLAAKAAAEAPFAAHISNGGSHDASQQAAILIAQVQAIVGGDLPAAASEEALAKVDEATGETKP